VRALALTPCVFAPSFAVWGVARPVLRVEPAERMLDDALCGSRAAETK